MNIAVFPATEFPASLAARWAEVQQQNPILCSPFFRPEFTQAIAGARKDVFVAVIDDGAAFFPFQRSSLGIGRPVGGTLSDCHGIIAPADYQCDLAALMRDCKLHCWNFDHVPAGQAIFNAWRTVATGSPVLDIADGVPSGSTNLYSDHRRKWRRLERDFGRIEVELETSDTSVLDLCLEWKSAQYRRTKNLDLFARPWARAVVEELSRCSGERFSGVLSVLKAGGRPVAAHFGIRSEKTWHYWFPAYDLQFQRYSPGILLLLKMIEGAPKLGIEVIDFGKGDNHYKLRLANRILPLMEGVVTTSKPLWLLSRSKAKLKQFARTAPSLKPILSPARSAIQWLRFR